MAMVMVEASRGALPATPARAAVGLVEKLRELLSNLILSARVGCLHRRTGRPYTADGMTFRVRADCGARRLFDLETWRTCGNYFFRRPGAAQFIAQQARRPARSGGVAARRLLRQAA
jgi:hypothetical protein